jgi:hypothetical protein
MKRWICIIVIQLFFPSVLLTAQNNEVYSDEFVIEPPTLISLGFEWYIKGDDNRNASVSVRYRGRDEKEWHEALPLLRLQNEELINTYNAFDYNVPNMFAGSIMDLQPDTEYEVNLRLTDPDGVENTEQKQFFVRTRPEPQPFASGQVFHVYPPPDLKVKNRDLHLQGSWVPFIPAQMARTGLTPTRQE